MKKKHLILVLSALTLVACNGGTSSASASGLSSQQSSASGLSSQQSSASGLSVSQSSASESSASSSQSASSSSESSYPSKVTLDFSGFVNEMNNPDGGDKEFSFHYDSTDFTKDNTVFNSNLAMLGFAMTSATKSADQAKTVFANAGFDEHLDVSTLEAEPTIDSVGFAIGSRRLADGDQIIIAFRGENYTKEWASNLYAIPDEEAEDFNGDHYGFHLAALKAQAAIKKFVTDNKLTNPRYLISGYSRGAAIADLTAALLIDDGNTDNVYCYTFCTPAAMLATNRKDAYDVIFNFINPNDAVPMFMPSFYNFLRPGVDINIAGEAKTFSEFFTQYGLYDPNIDEETDFSIFNLKDAEGNVTCSGKDVFSTIINTMGREVSQRDLDHGAVCLHTEEDYRDNLQTPIRELVEDFFSFTDLKFSMDALGPVLADAAGALVNLSLDDGFGETELPYDPHNLAGLLKKLLAAQNYYPEGEDPEPSESSESSEPATIHHYDGERMNRNADAIQAVLRTVNLGLTQRFLDQGCELDDARNKLASLIFSVALSMGRTFVSRHAIDTTYALVRHFCETLNQ